jgi:hypothetical protein
MSYEFISVMNNREINSNHDFVKETNKSILMMV